MDMTGDMPHKAWVEIHGERGELLASVPSAIDGGTISTRLPVFAPNRLGTITLVTEYRDGEVHREQGELALLPTRELINVVQMG